MEIQKTSQSHSCKPRILHPWIKRGRKSGLWFTWCKAIEAEQRGRRAPLPLRPPEQEQWWGSDELSASLRPAPPAQPLGALKPVLTVLLTAVTETMESKIVGLEGVPCNPEADGPESVVSLNWLPGREEQCVGEGEFAGWGFQWAVIMLPNIMVGNR